MLNVHAALGIWLDFGVDGDHLGTRFQPYSTVPNALAATPWTGVLNIKPGSTGWTGTINQYIRIRAPEGPVTLGQ